MYYRTIISATSKEEANQIVKLLLEKKLIAGGLVSSGDSYFWWEGKVDNQRYFNISAFTIEEHKDTIIEEIEKTHSDEIPIITFYKIDHANKKFLKWVKENTHF